MSKKSGPKSLFKYGLLALAIVSIPAAIIRSGGLTGQFIFGDNFPPIEFYHWSAPYNPNPEPEDDYYNSSNGYEDPGYEVPSSPPPPPATTTPAASSSSSLHSAAPASCPNGEGLQVCRCYCRVSVPTCTNGHTSYASMPLCSVEWENGSNCSSIEFYNLSNTDAASCGAMDGQTCTGYVRPSTNPGEIGNLETDGAYLGCEIVGLQ